MLEFYKGEDFGEERERLISDLEIRVAKDKFNVKPKAKKMV